MSFKEAVQVCFSKYATISGRAPRSEYWFFVLFGILGGLVAGLLDAMLVGVDSNFQPLSTIFGLGILLPSITVSIRRLHDRDMSGWWFLLAIVPLIGSIILFVIFVMRGTDGRNRFGPDPLSSNSDHNDDGDYTQSSIPKSGN